MTDKTEAPEQIWINPEEWNKYSGPCVGDPAVPYVPKALLDQKQDLFERMWDADMRGIEAWRKAHPGNDLVMPDRADMMEWLCGQRHEGAEVIGAEVKPYWNTNTNEAPKDRLFFGTGQIGQREDPHKAAYQCTWSEKDGRFLAWHEFDWICIDLEQWLDEARTDARAEGYGAGCHAGMDRLASR